MPRSSCIKKQWSPTWRACFNGLEMTIILACELTQYNFEFIHSSVVNVVDGVLTTVIIDANQVIVYYYTTLIYQNTSIGTFYRPAVYGESSKVITVKDFSKCALQLQLRHNLKNLFRAIQCLPVECKRSTMKDVR